MSSTPLNKEVEEILKNLIMFNNFEDYNEDFEEEVEQAKSLIMELISKEKAKSRDMGFNEGQIAEKVKPHKP